MVQERCPEGHPTKRGPNLILFYLLELDENLHGKEYIHFRVFSPIP